MSTRGAVGFKLNGELKVSYNHCDSYPTGLGQEVVDFIKKNINRLDVLRKNVENVILVSEDSIPTKEQVDKYSQYSDNNVGGSGPEWYKLLRELQGIRYLEAIMDEGLDVMLDSHGFLSDGLFCEYAYVIDFDTNELHFFKGFSKSKPTSNPLGLNMKANSDGYWPIACVASVKFEELKAAETYYA